MNSNYKNLFLLGTIATGSMMIGMTSCCSDDKTNTSTGVEIVKVNGVSLDKGGLTLTIGKKDTLKAVVTPENAYITSVTWSSSDEKIVIVNEKGVVTALAEGNATITATANDLSGKKGSCNVVVSKEMNHRKLVSKVGEVDRYGVQLWDGGPYWAEFNVGATIKSYSDVTNWSNVVTTNEGTGKSTFGTSVADTTLVKSWVGNYYNWGVVMDEGLLTNKGRYLLNDELASEGLSNISGKSKIKNNDTLGDAATKNWGAEWRLPDNYELSGLDLMYGKVDTCWKDGINKQFSGSSIPGMCFIGKGDYKNDTVFFPAAGSFGNGYFVNVGTCNYCWSSVPIGSYAAWSLCFNIGCAIMDYYDRYYGHSVRAVCAK
ncbi:MAG TPA: hypothetical protein DDY68_04770 [Porphyromonadaceae bacterium]|nr:hypothetical protein [Porphyromonadaceae bacterium]